MGVALTTTGTLILELSLTRIFSVVFYYHLAFLAISIALFGLGAGGVFSYVVAGWRGSFFQKLGWLAIANGLGVLCSLTFVITRHGNLGAGTLAAIYFACSLPFFFSGATVSLAVAETIARVDRVYFFDLLGASAGCLLLVPFLNDFGGPNTVISAAVLFAVSAAMWFNLAGSLAGRAAAVVLALGVVVLMFYNGKQHVIDIRYAKGNLIPHEDFVQWNSFSRIGVHGFGGGDREIFIDADASTGVVDFDPLDPRRHDELLYQGPGFPYVMRPGAKTLIIGPGGGWDVARCLASGSKDVTGVEINPIIATTLMRQRLVGLSRGLYLRPDVHIFVEDGRSFVRRSPEKYQVLQATLVDTWASTAAGAFALSESNLYTTDAFRDYLSHLTDDGLMAFTRWGFEIPRESLRLLSLAMEALGDRGEAEPWKHVVVLREDAARLGGWGAQDTVLIFRKPMSSEDLKRLRDGLAQSKLQLLYAPGDPPVNVFGELLRSPDPKAFWAGYPFNVSPVPDDRPFFFYTVQPADVWQFLKQGGQAADYKINRAVPILFELVGVSLLATIVIIALPPMLLGTRLPAEPGVRRMLSYFLCIGVGYIMIQVALIQKFVLFLGHPTYALTVVVFSMLISSGLGSYYSRRLIHSDAEHRLTWVLGGVMVAVSVLAFIAAPVGAIGVGWPLPIKMLVTVCLIAPVGFLMGMPFPTGLSRLEARFPRAVRWAWSLNAAASVLGSACAILLAIYLGLRMTVLLGGALYLGALAVVWLDSRARIAVTPAVAVLKE